MQHLQVNNHQRGPVTPTELRAGLAHTSVRPALWVRLSPREQAVPTPEEEAVLKGRMFQEELLRQNLMRGKKCKEKINK